MSGHNKWSGIKHRKEAQDAKRAEIFTKLGRLISVAAKEGGGSLETNFKLKLAVDKAKSANMPKDKIERAIKRGTGENKNETIIEEIIYEAYGPGNIAMLIKVLTENKNRTLGEIKNILNKNEGKIVPSGSVAFLFKQMGMITIPIQAEKWDEIELKAIEAGAEDLERAKKTLLVYTQPTNLMLIKEKLEAMEIKIEDVSIVYLTKQKTAPSEKSLSAYQKLREKLLEQDDIQEIYDNIG